MKNILWYIIALYVISYLLQIIIITNGGLESNLFKTLAPIIMYMPALFVMIYLIITKKGIKSINWKIGKPIYLIYGALIPAFLSLLIMALIAYFDLGESEHISLIDNRVNVLKGRFIFGNGEQSYFIFFINLVLTAIVFSLVSGIFAFGEELGWRGFLQEKMMKRFGFLKGVTILGLIWGFWHLPLIISGYNYPENPILGALVLFPLLAVFASFFLAWLTLKANSFWPAVLAHGSINVFIGTFVLGMNFGENRLLADILMLAIWFIIALLSFLSLKKDKNLLKITK